MRLQDGFLLYVSPNVRTYISLETSPPWGIYIWHVPHVDSYFDNNVRERGNGKSKWFKAGNRADNRKNQGG